MIHSSTKVKILTSPKTLNEITKDVIDLVDQSGVTDGLCNIFIKHTSASLTIQENADDSVLRDIESFLHRLVPEDLKLYEHITEGSDDMPSHIRSLLTNSNLTIPICKSKLELGVWQGIFLYEHRSKSHEREIIITFSGN